MEREEMIQYFKQKLASVNRPGCDKLLEFIEKSDFFRAPASTRFHGAYEGGLLRHSINVYECLNNKKFGDPFWQEKLDNVSNESIVIVSLLHDICKTYFYTTEMRNKKVDGQWIQVPFYTVDDKFPYGHGEKSVMMIEKYMRLRSKEQYAIRWHMGPYSGQQDWNTFGMAVEKYPLVLALFEADVEATHIVEANESGK